MVDGRWVDRSGSRQAVSRRRLIGVGAGIAGAAAFALACGSGGNKQETHQAQPQVTATAQQGGDQVKRGGAVHVRFNGTPPLDPIANTSFRAQTMAGYTYSRLLKFKTGEDPAVAANFEVMPDLAASWEIPGDGTQVTFKLQPNAAF